MNLEKLFQTQKELGQVGLFNYRGPDRFNKLILALLVELGECANEWRGFKFWSVNQLPHTSAVRVPCMMEEDKEYYNPLLEEYVDGLHFVLELGIEIQACEVEDWFVESNVNIYSNSKGVTEQFIDVYDQTMIFVGDFKYKLNNDEKEEYENLVYSYLGLGEMLGFTWEQIEQAYFTKNKINHQRQSEGY